MGIKKATRHSRNPVTCNFEVSSLRFEYNRSIIVRYPESSANILTSEMRGSDNPKIQVMVPPRHYCGIKSISLMYSYIGKYGSLIRDQLPACGRKKLTSDYNRKMPLN